MMRYLACAISLAALAWSASAIASDCANQLADIQGPISSELMAQSAIAQQFEEAERACKAGAQTKAQALISEIREEMAAKGPAGNSGAPTRAGSSIGNSTAPSK
jgi:hypothetical protein